MSEDTSRKSSGDTDRLGTPLLRGGREGRRGRREASTAPRGQGDGPSGPSYEGSVQVVDHGARLPNIVWPRSRLSYSPTHVPFDTNPPCARPFKSATDVLPPGSATTGCTGGGLADREALTILAARARRLGRALVLHRMIDRLVKRAASGLPTPMLGEARAEKRLGRVGRRRPSCAACRDHGVAAEEHRVDRDLHHHRHHRDRRARLPDRAAGRQRRGGRCRTRLRCAEPGQGLPLRHLHDLRGPVRRR